MRLQQSQVLQHSAEEAHSKPYLSIVIPCYNEASLIEKTAETVIRYLETKYSYHHCELLLIDDGSTDQTAERMNLLQDKYRQVHCVFLPINQGRGAAIKAGIGASKGKYLILMDADLSYDVDHIGEIMDNFAANPKTDVVVVSPYMKGGIAKAVPWNKLAISRLANWILSGFFDSALSTVTCVVRGYDGDKVRSLPLFEGGKELHLEILRKMSLCGGVVREIPGRLIWKDGKRAKRQNNLNLMKSAQKHFLYGTLANPTRMFRLVAMLLLFVGLYECGAILFSVLTSYNPQVNFFVDISHALKKGYAQSPHTFILAGVALILGFQALSFLAIVGISRMQHEETLRHQLEILTRLPQCKQ